MISGIAWTIPMTIRGHELLKALEHHPELDRLAPHIPQDDVINAADYRADQEQTDARNAAGQDHRDHRDAEIHPVIVLDHLPRVADASAAVDARCVEIECCVIVVPRWLSEILTQLI